MNKIQVKLHTKVWTGFIHYLSYLDRFLSMIKDLENSKRRFFSVIQTDKNFNLKVNLINFEQHKFYQKNYSGIQITICSIKKNFRDKISFNNASVHHTLILFPFNQTFHLTKCMKFLYNSNVDDINFSFL